MPLLRFLQLVFALLQMVLGILIVMAQDVQPLALAWLGLGIVTMYARCTHFILLPLILNLKFLAVLVICLVMQIFFIKAAVLPLSDYGMEPLLIIWSFIAFPSMIQVLLILLEQHWLTASASR